MSEGQQEPYQHDINQSSVDHHHQQQQQQQIASPTQDSTHKRKRESIEDGSSADIDDARAPPGDGSGRRTSIKHTSPNMSAFMPINPNSPQNVGYAYQPLNAQQQPPNTINGSSATDAANAALAANAMSSLLPSLGGAGMSFPSQDQGKPADQHAQLNDAFSTMSPQPNPSPEGVGGLPLAAPRPVQQAVQPPAKPQVGTEEWHRVRRDNHKEGA